MKQFTISILMIICIFTTSCFNDVYNKKLHNKKQSRGQKSDDTTQVPQNKKSLSPQVDKNVDEPFVAVDEPIVISNEETNELAKSNMDFAWSLYSQLANSSSENLFFSPYSISTVLAMTYSGAKEKTREEMKSALRFTLPDAKIHHAFSNLIQQSQSSQDYILNVANSIWVDDTLSPEEQFLHIIRNKYHSDVNNVDFISASEPSRLQINRWVEDNTNNKIKNLLKREDINSDTRLILTNAIHFKGQWQQPFDNGETRKDKFFGTKESKVPMMNMTEYFLYHSNENFQAIELPYEGNSLVGMIVLPAQNRPFAQAIQSFDVQDFLVNAKNVNVYLTVPKFKLEAQQSLNKPLQNLGMERAFDSYTANFSGIAKGDSLKISKVIHKAFIEFNEKGTEAAAASAVVMEDVSATEYLSDEPIRLNINRPFVFLIFDKKTKSILFLGRIVEI